VSQYDGTRVPIDKQHRAVYLAQINVAKAARKAAQAAGMSRDLVELINIRISQINGCAHCLDTHISEPLRHGEEAQRIAVLPAWRETTLFTANERAALTLAESVTTLPDARTQEQDYTDAHEHLTADELAAVSWIAITMNAFNRISIVSRHAVRSDAEPRPDGQHRAQKEPT
jgi:AhpD family alkylhydroperoxidase